jgi:hypothetical protein
MDSHAFEVAPGRTAAVNKRPLGMMASMGTLFKIQKAHAGYLIQQRPGKGSESGRPRTADSTETLLRKEGPSMKKTLNVLSSDDRKEKVNDVQTFGADLWRLISKAYSEEEGWMKSTKAMEIPGAGCLVQVTTHQKNYGGTHSIAEALTFVPGVQICTDIAGRPFLQSAFPAQVGYGGKTMEEIAREIAADFSTAGQTAPLAVPEGTLVMGYEDDDKPIDGMIKAPDLESDEEAPHLAGEPLQCPKVV